MHEIIGDPAQMDSWMRPGEIEQGVSDAHVQQERSSTAPPNQCNGRRRVASRSPATAASCAPSATATPAIRPADSGRLQLEHDKEPTQTVAQWSAGYRQASGDN